MRQMQSHTCKVANASSQSHAWWKAAEILNKIGIFQIIAENLHSEKDVESFVIFFVKN